MTKPNQRNDRGDAGEPGRRRPERAEPARTPPGPRVAQRGLEVDARAAFPEVLLKSFTSYPLVYRKRIARIDSAARPGDLVAVYAPPYVERSTDTGATADDAANDARDDDEKPVPFGASRDRDAHDEKLLGYGFFNPKSEIQVRVLRQGEELPDPAWWDTVLGRALALRRDVLGLDAVTDACRLVHAEADGMSGLMIDRYGDVLSAEAFSLGMYVRGRALLERLHPILGTRHSIVRPSPHFLAQEGFDAPIVVSEGAPAQVTITEHGVRFRVRFEGGHKTGYFCDQRDNRRRLAELCRGKSVLDLCCYSGGFSVHAKKAGGATEVTAVDLDEEPLALARENANLNQVRINFVQDDAFTYMRDRLQHGHLYDVVVLDPPKLIRSRLEFEEGRRKYFDMNRLAMQLVKPGGLFLTCSCSGLMPEEEFTKLVVSASRQAGPELPEKTATGRPKHAARGIQILARTGASPDHPVNPFVPETAYLKAIWARLD